MPTTEVKTKGALCKACGQRMLVADGCKKIPVPIFNGPIEPGKRRKKIKVLDPIKYGDEKRFGPATNSPGISGALLRERCPDCGTKAGNFHHPNCDVEECPACHRQLLMCGGECGTNLKTFRVWKNFKDSSNDVAVLVDAENETAAKKAGMEMLKDEPGLGLPKSEQPIGYTVEAVIGEYMNKPKVRESK